LELYKELGGDLVTIGSDAHTLDAFDDYYDVACEIIDSMGFELLQINTGRYSRL
jgi:histidinol-phosphatase (PHP family)